MFKHVCVCEHHNQGRIQTKTKGELQNDRLKIGGLGTCLPGNFEKQGIFEKCRGVTDTQKPILDTALTIIIMHVDVIIHYTLRAK